MGWTYEVEAWTVICSIDSGGTREHKYDYMPVYTGESLFKAVLAMRKAKKYSGCVKLTWR